MFCSHCLEHVSHMFFIFYCSSNARFCHGFVLILRWKQMIFLSLSLVLALSLQTLSVSAPFIMFSLSFYNALFSFLLFKYEKERKEGNNKNEHVAINVSCF